MAIIQAKFREGGYVIEIPDTVLRVFMDDIMFFSLIITALIDYL